MRQDASVKRGLRKSQRRRRQGMIVYNRGNRDWYKREICGKILQLPDPALPASDLQIQHEPIPSFANGKGEVVGMRAMAMPFPVAPAVSLDGLAVDDLVEFTFEVRWGEEGPRWRVTRITELPAGTTLDFGPPKGG